MIKRHIEEKLSDMFDMAVNAFDRHMNTDMKNEDIKIAFFDSSNGIEVCKEFCGKYFPKQYEIKYTHQEFFANSAAVAFVSDEHCGILIKTDTGDTYAQIMHTLIHEIAHCFCTRNEIDGGNFYEKHCKTESENISIGYKIWREAIADIIAEKIITGDSFRSIEYFAEQINYYYDMIHSSDMGISIQALSLVAVATMVSYEVLAANEWSEAKPIITNMTDIKEEETLKLLEKIYCNIKKPKYWEISKEFIDELGNMYYAIRLVKMDTSLEKFREIIVSETE